MVGHTNAVASDLDRVYRPSIYDVALNFVV